MKSKKLKTFFQTKRNFALLITCSTLLLATIVQSVINGVWFSHGKITQSVLFRRVGFAGIWLAVVTALFLAEKLLSLRFSALLEFSIVLFSFACLGLGTVFNFYGLVPIWDKILHTTSGFLFSAVGLSLALVFLRGETDRHKLLSALVIAFLFSLAVGYVWEMFEYTVDSILPSFDNQRWQGGIIESFPDGTYLVNDRRGSALHDTMLDMIVNFFGSLVFLLAILFACLKKPTRLECFAIEKLPRKEK